jgi:hypothetical protein
MSVGELAQLITAVATLIASIGAFAIGWHNSNKIEVIHQATNGLTSKLVGLTATSSKAEGNLEGRAELKAEQHDATP